MEDIITSYTRADYCVDRLDEPIRVGTVNDGVEELLKQHRVRSWCFVTAWNPLSVELSDLENRLRNLQLKLSLSKYDIFDGEGCDPDGEWSPEKSFLVLGISTRDAKRLARSYCQRAVVFGRRGKPAELIETLFTSGNCDLIRETKSAFLGSRKLSKDIGEKCLEWATAQRNAGRCVISGFHSPIEKEVLTELLNGVQPVIQVLARGIQKRNEAAVAEALTDGRMLVIAPFDEKTDRASSATATIRNRLIVDLADDIVCGQTADSELLGVLPHEAGKPVKFL